MLGFGSGGSDETTGRENQARIQAGIDKPKPRAEGRAEKPARKVAKPRLLSGENPKIAKGDGDAPVQAYIKAIPGWKRDVARRVDALVVRALPKVQKAVKWNSPFYGVEGQGLVPEPPLLQELREARVLQRRGADPSPARQIYRRRKCATSTSTRTTRSTKSNSPRG